MQEGTSPKWLEETDKERLRRQHMKATAKCRTGVKEQHKDKNTTARDDDVDTHFKMAVTLREKNSIWESDMEEARKGERKRPPKQEGPQRERS